MIWSNYLRQDFEFEAADLSTQDEKLTYLYNAVTKNNVKALRRFLRLQGRFDFTDSNNETVLHLAVQKQKVAVFDYLLESRQIEIDAKNVYGQTALINATHIGDEYFTLKLIEKGADVKLSENLNFFEPTILLHKIILEYSVEFCCELFEKKSDLLNLTDAGGGQTILMRACQLGHVELVGVLLYYGADVLILDNHGNSAFDIAAKCGDIDLEILFYYYFEEGTKYCVYLTTLVGVLINSHTSCGIITEFLDKVSDVDYDSEDLEYLAENFHLLKIERFLFLLENYSYILKEMAEQSSFDWFTSFTNTQVEDKDFTNKLFLLLENEELALAFSNNLNNHHSNFLMRVLTSLAGSTVALETITQLVCAFFSYGFNNISSFSVALLFLNFGYCQLFKFLLHMDLPNLNIYFQDTIVHAIVNVDRKIEALFADDSSELYSDRTLEIFLDYFALSSLKNICLRRHKENLKKKVLKLPKVPFLVELARNAIRDFLVESLEVRECKWFYTKVQALPISRNQKELITFERKIYCNI